MKWLYEAVFRGPVDHCHVLPRVYFLHDRIEALKEAIAAHQDIEVIKSLFEGGRVPDEVRADFWKVS